MSNPSDSDPSDCHTALAVNGKNRLSIGLTIEDSQRQVWVRDILTQHYDVHVLPLDKQTSHLELHRSFSVLVLDEADPRATAMIVTALKTNPSTADILVLLLKSDVVPAAPATYPAHACPDAFMPVPFTEQELLVTVARLAELAQLRHQNAAQSAEHTRIIDNFSESFIAVDANWRITHMNAAAERFVQVRRSDVLGKDAWEVFPETRNSPRATIYRRVMQERRPARLDISMPEAGSLQIDAVPFEEGGLAVYFRSTTPLKEAEAAAAASQRRLRLFLEHAKDYALVLMDSEFRVLEWLGGAEAITGWSPEEMAGWSLERLFTPEDRAAGKPQEETRKAVAFGSADNMRWHLKKDGSSFFAQGITTAFRDEAGELQGFGKIFRDATAHKLAEDALQESERRLRFVMDTMPQKIFTTTPSGESEYVNPAWAKFTGRSIEELQKLDWSKLVHPDDLEKNQQQWQDCLARGEPFQVEHRLLNAEGQWRWHLSRATPMHNEAGEIVMWVGSNTDIHQVKAAEVELGHQLASEQHHAALLADIAAASEAIHAVLSVDGIARILAEKTRTILNTRDAVVVLGPANRPTAYHAHSVDTGSDDSYKHYPADRSLYGEICRTNKPMRLSRDELQDRLTEVTNAGTEPLVNSYLAAPLIGHGGRNLGAVQAFDKYERDFTDEDEAVLAQLAVIAAVGIENALLYDSLREQDRRKDEFLATLAHELRNPLAPLRTGLDILALAGGDDKARQMQSMMDRQLRHMVRLVDDLMDVSRVSRGKIDLKYEQIPLRAVVDSAVEAVTPLIEARKHKLEVVIPDSSLRVNGDLTRLSQVLSNLLNNAAKYTPEGGKIELAVVREDQQAVIHVADTGVGLSEEMLPVVFDLFTQADSSTGDSLGGLGIGLSLVQKLVELHGGSVSVQSAGAAQGSTFTVRLPLREPGEDTGPASKGAAVAPGAAARRILVVDDNTDAAEALSSFLELSGHEVKIAYDGLSALAAVEHFRPHVVFLDIGLPGMSGYEIASELRENPTYKGLVLIALTGWGTAADRRRTRESGFDYHLAKPATAQELTHVLNQFLPECGAP